MHHTHKLHTRPENIKFIRLYHSNATKKGDKRALFLYVCVRAFNVYATLVWLWLFYVYIQIFLLLATLTQPQYSHNHKKTYALWNTKIQWSSINERSFEGFFLFLNLSYANIYHKSVLIFFCMSVYRDTVISDTQNDAYVWKSHLNTYFVEFILRCVLFFSVFLFFSGSHFLSDLITVYTGFNLLHTCRRLFYLLILSHHLFVGSFYGLNFYFWKMGR